MGRRLDFYSGEIARRVGASNQWVRLSQLVNWEKFRVILKELDRTGERGGRPPYDPVMMFKIVLLGQWHNLSDNEMEHALQVRLDFMLFCCAGLSESVPDSTTIQDFRAKMTEAGLLKGAMDMLNKELEKAGLRVKGGSMIIDSTTIEAAARPRNVIELGDDDEPPTKTTSADPDAEWTKKGSQYHYGYKEHVLVNAEDGYIEDVQVTGAATHDGKMLKSLLDDREDVTELLADKGYASQENRNYLESKQVGDKILHKAARNKPLTKEQLKHNTKISKLRFVVEQQFGTKKRKFGFFQTRYFTLVRVQAQSYLKAICFNLLKASNLLKPQRIVAT